MKNRSFRSFGVVLAAMVFAVLLASVAPGQTVKPQKGRPSKLPEVKQIDAAGLKAVMKPNGRPLLVNFWATWCDPCREEFPDLVKFANEYKGRIDFITISMDDLAEIKRDVPNFLVQMKAKMPAYLLKTPDEDAAITSLSLPWHGALPLSVIYNSTGEAIYVRQGKLVPDKLRAELEKLLAPAPSTAPSK